jgi:hypothetical protein
MKKLSAAILSFSVAGAIVGLNAHAPSGAIFTTVADGTEVNFNIYGAKEDVYLDGGPGPGAPQTAAGLDDGIYVFQVTDPSGKVLLSTDPAGCRRFSVANGVISSVAPSGSCAHVTGLDVDHSATTVQLMPYNDTPNPGNEYKVWVTRVEDYVCSDNWAIVDCGGRGSLKHGFYPRHSKTDNYKVNGSILEIDARFFPDYNGNGVRDWGEDWMDGLAITWTDTLGASNRKHSYYAPELVVNHEAHVEAVEDGRHTITVDNQPGCTVGGVSKGGRLLTKRGPQDVTVSVPQDFKTDTVFVDVACIQ